MTISNHDDLLNAAADAIDISPEMAERAVARYQSIGEWLDRDASEIAKFDPDVYTQGSFLLGTVIRPIGDADEFDIDLVCKLNATTYDYSMSSLKNAVGDELVAYAEAYNMNKKPEDKRRCWTIEYSDKAKFHLDVLPAIPNEQGYRVLLEEREFREMASNSSITQTAIGITDNELPQYEARPADWPVSNPKGFAAWFHSRQSKAVQKSREMIFAGSREKVYESVDDVPQYHVKTPLQKCIQLLKRHRDSMFDGDEHKSISVIITTLSGHAYQGEETLSSTMRGVLTSMDSFIEQKDNVDWIANPVNPSENFADKWPEHPERKENFHSWLDQARRDFGGYLNGPFDGPNEGLIGSISQNTMGRVTSMFALAAPAIASAAEKAQAEAAHAETTGESSKPWQSE